MDIVHNLKISTTPSALYELFTTEAGINKWWSLDCELAQKPGDISRLRFTKGEDKIEMGFRLDEWIPHQKVVWTCVENANPAWINTTLHFLIQEAHDAVDFTFQHQNWDEKWKGQLPYEQTKHGWEHFMKSLKDSCEKGVGEPW